MEVLMADAVLTRARTWATVAFAVQGLMQALVLTNLPGLEEQPHLPIEAADAVHVAIWTTLFHNWLDAIGMLKGK